MIQIALIFLCTILYSANSVPTPKTDTPTESSQSLEVIYVPYDVKYVPIGINPQANKKDVLKPNLDIQQALGEYVLVPESVLKNLQNEKNHVRSKRQASPQGFVVYAPLVRVRRQVSDRRRIFRRPGLVGYLNNYDHFPTVA